MSLLDVARRLDLSRGLRAVDVARRWWFSVDVPSADGIVVDAEPSVVNKWLRDNHHFEKATAAYYYVGELHNLRRAEGFDTITTPKGERDVMMELHPRLFKIDADSYSTFVHVHYEASRVESPDAHIAEYGMSWDEGVSRTLGMLAESEFDYKHVTDENPLHPSEA